MTVALQVVDPFKGIVVGEDGTQLMLVDVVRSVTVTVVVPLLEL